MRKRFVLDGEKQSLIIFPRNTSLREYFVFVSNTAAVASAAAASQFRCKYDNFWRI